MIEFQIYQKSHHILNDLIKIGENSIKQTICLPWCCVFMEGARVILYDGYCKLCSRTVRWVKRYDRKGRFRFEPLQKEGPGEQPLSAQLSPEQTSLEDTVVLLEGGKRYERSTAAIRIAMGLRFPWPLLGILFIVPRFARDGVYNMIARNRKRWFGEHTTCYLPED